MLRKILYRVLLTVIIAGVYVAAIRGSGALDTIHCTDSRAVAIEKQREKQRQCQKSGGGACPQKPSTKATQSPHR